jgi:Flp pilus assembly protein TadB
MSKERARRRAEREKEAAVMAAARASAAEKRERRAARSRTVTSRLPQRHSRQTGLLAQRRRRQTSITVAVVVALNLLVWVVAQSVAASAFVLCSTLLGAPVLHTVLFRR